MAPGKCFQLTQSRHGTVLIQYFAYHAGGFQSGESGQIHAGLRVSRPGEHAAALSHQREYMTRLYQIARLGILFNRDLNGPGAIRSGNPRGHADRGFDGHREIGYGSVIRIVHHERQLQLAAAIGGQCQANQSAPVACHEIDILGARMYSGHDQVTFVFTVLIIHQNDHTAVSDFVDDLVYRADRHKIS